MHVEISHLWLVWTLCASVVLVGGEGYWDILFCLRKLKMKLRTFVTFISLFTFSRLKSDTPVSGCMFRFPYHQVHVLFLCTFLVVREDKFVSLKKRGFIPVVHHFLRSQRFNLEPSTFWDGDEKFVWCQGWIEGFVWERGGAELFILICWNFILEWSVLRTSSFSFPAPSLLCLTSCLNYWGLQSMAFKGSWM